MSDDLRELDAQIAEKIMGWDSGAMLATHDPKIPVAYSLPHYSTDIRFAFKVVKKMREFGAGTTFHVPQHASGAARVEMNVPSSECQEWGESASEAICKCALKAIEKFEIEPKVNPD